MMLAWPRCVPIASEGWVFIVPPVVVTGGCWLLGWWPVALAFLVLTCCVAAFFRDPERRTPAQPEAVVSPADGRVVAIANEPDGRRISIFLSVLNVHINRAPYGGRIRDIIYTPGQFLAAYRPEASHVNESNSITICGPRHTMVVKQIAGVLARRIVCRVQAGSTLEKGQRYGLIRFGSRTEVVLPTEAEVRVEVGHMVKGGETIIATLKEPLDI